MDYLGIDIGGTDVKVGIVDASGEVLISDELSVILIIIKYHLWMQ